MSTTGRFSRSDYNPARLFGSRVLVVGAGALGQSNLVNLALSGLGEIGIVDKDVFEDHNRTRSELYPFTGARRPTDYKSASVAGRLLPMMTAPTPTVRYAVNWIQELGDIPFVHNDVVLSAVDNLAARAYLSDKCRLHRKVFVEAGFRGPELTMAVFLPNPDGPCWRCSNHVGEGSFSCATYAREAEEAGVIPAIQNGAAALAGYQSEAAVLALHGKYPLGQKRLVIDLRTGKHEVIELSVDPRCPGVHRNIGVERVVQTSSRHEVGELVSELCEATGSQVSVQLPFAFVEAAPCPSCGEMTDVHQPDWLWAKDRRCKECGGPLQRQPGSAGFVAPRVTTILDQASAVSLLRLPCSSFGIAPGCYVEAQSQGGEGMWARLPGSIDDVMPLTI